VAMVVEETGVPLAAAPGPKARQGRWLGWVGELLEVVVELLEGDRAQPDARLVRAAGVVLQPGRRRLVVLVVVG
jgi:hypothetical protein